MSNEKASPPFPLQPVTSSNILAVGYDAPTQRFGVQFKGSGGTYHYAGVSAETAKDVLEAASVGSAVHTKLVRGGFAYSRLSEKKAD